MASFRIRAANAYLGLEPESDWLLDTDCPVPRCDLRKPGAVRPMWFWRQESLDAFLRSREVAPGQPNPQDRQ